jgi:hypothetical protein
LIISGLEHCNDLLNRQNRPPLRQVDVGGDVAGHQDKRLLSNHEAATRLIWLALQNITANWGSAAHDWKSAMNQFAV